MKRRLLYVCLSVAIAGSIPTSFAQISSAQSSDAPVIPQGQTVQAEQVERDTSAVSALSRVWAALGSGVADADGTIHISGNAEMYAGKSSGAAFQISFDPPENQGFAVTDNAGNTYSTTLSSYTLSMTRPGRGTVVLPLHKALNLPPYFFPLLIHRALSDSSYSIVSKGSTPINGVDYVTVELKKVYTVNEDKYQELSQFTDRVLYIDPTTYEVKRVAYTSYSNSSITVSSHRALDFSSYQQFGSLRFPSSISDSINDRLISRFVVTQISAN